MLRPLVDQLHPFKSEPNKSGCTQGNSLDVQWLELRALTAEGPGSIPGRATKVLRAMWCSQKIKSKPQSGHA